MIRITREQIRNLWTLKQLCNFVRLLCGWSFIFFSIAFQFSFGQRTFFDCFHSTVLRSRADSLHSCLTVILIWFSVALRPQRRVGLLGTGTEWEGGDRVKGSTAETAQKRPERPWTAARTMEVLRQCPLAIAQQLVHCAIALSTAVLDRVTKTMSVAPLLTNNLDNLKQKTSNLLSPAPPPYSWSLLGKSEGPAPPPSSKIFWSHLEPCMCDSEWVTGFL